MTAGVLRGWGVMMAQMGFFDLSDRYASLDAKRDPLVEFDAVVPWDEFRPTLERVWRKREAERNSRAGCKPMDAVLMFNTLVLSALYNLSDDQIEYQVRDPLSFMRFLGLGLEDRVPPTTSAHSPVALLFLPETVEDGRARHDHGARKSGREARNAAPDRPSIEDPLTREDADRRHHAGSNR